MSNELIKRESMPHSEMMEMAKMFVDSKMFTDMNQVAMAFVKIQAGKEIGISPFAAMSGIHIIKGKASIGAGLMAGCVKGSGKYDYSVVKMDEKICSIDFMQGSKKIGNSTFTIEDAKKAGTQNLDKFPKNMLFARAMSNGVKWYCPDVFTMPVYTPEEMGDASLTEDISAELVQSTGQTGTTATVIPSYTELELQQATTTLQAATNLPQLQVAFTGLSKELQAAVYAVKDEMKLKLTPAAEQPAQPNA